MDKLQLVGSSNICPESTFIGWFKHGGEFAPASAFGFELFILPRSDFFSYLNLPDFILEFFVPFIKFHFALQVSFVVFVIGSSSVGYLLYSTVDSSPM